MNLYYLFGIVGFIVYKNPIYYNIVETAIKTLYTIAVQSMIYKNIKKINRNIYEVGVYIENKPYNVRVKIQRGPSLLEDVLYENKSVLKDIEPYLNVANIEFVSVTPSEIGYTKPLTFDYGGDFQEIKPTESLYKLKNE